MLQFDGMLLDTVLTLKGHGFRPLRKGYLGLWLIAGLDGVKKFLVLTEHHFPARYGEGRGDGAGKENSIG